MAPSPWPDYQCTEPKAPDKKTDVSSSGDGEVATTSEEKNQAGDDKGGNEIEIGQLKPQVTALDEYGLKALLDEAMTLRFSEDVEGKSVLLQGLFEEVNAKKPSRAVTEVPKQSSSSGKQSKKSKVRRSHAVSDQNEIVTYSKHKSDSKTQSKSIVGPKNVEAIESEACKLSSIGRMNTETKRGKQIITSLDDGQKQMGSSDEGCDMAKVVTIPGGSKNSSEGKNPKNVIKIPPVTEVDKKPKEHYTPNIDKICRKIDQKDIDKALSQSPSVKEISIPSTQLNSNKVANIALPKNQTDPENQQSTVEEKKSPDLSDASKTVNSETDMSGRYLQLVGEDQLLKIKKIDENGNAVCSSKGVDDGRKGKTRRVKVKNDKNMVMSQNIEGYRGDTDIEAVIQYIESTDEKQSRKNNRQPGITLPVSKQGRISQKIRPIRDKSSEAIGRKGRKNNESKLKKCNSLEEVSSSKLEDLTSSFPECSKSQYLDDGDISHMPCKFDSKAKSSDTKTETVTAAPVVPIDSAASNKILDSKKESRSENESDGESEFHIVRKKQRKKKKMTTSQDDRRNSKNAGISSSSFSRRFNDSARSRRGILKNFGYLEEPRGRKPAASVPPSDKSADSSDADSVHSLPVSSSSKNNAGTNESSLTSYADIARSVTTPPRGGSTPILNKPTTSLSNDLTKAHCVSSEEIPCVTLPMPKNRRSVYPSASLDITNIDKDYPPLKKVTDKKTNDMFVEFTLQLPKSNKAKGNQVTVEETVSIKRPVENKCITESTTLSMPLDDGSSKRPPVILMDEKKGQESTAANELVFGFEVNQQLLAPGQSDSSHQPKEIIPHQNKSTASEEDSVENDSNDQNHHSMSFNHYSIVQYISREWNLTMEELANDKSGKIVYYRGG